MIFQKQHYADKITISGKNQGVNGGWRRINKPGIESLKKSVKLPCKCDNTTICQWNLRLFSYSILQSTNYKAIGNLRGNRQ
jgi:hypothetical protein